MSAASFPRGPHFPEQDFHDPGYPGSLGRLSGLRPWERAVGVQDSPALTSLFPAEFEQAFISSLIYNWDGEYLDSPAGPQLHRLLPLAQWRRGHVHQEPRTSLVGLSPAPSQWCFDEPEAVVRPPARQRPGLCGDTFIHQVCDMQFQKDGLPELSAGSVLTLQFY